MTHTEVTYMKKKIETPLQGYLSSIVAFIIATAFGIVVFSAVSQRAVESLAQSKLMMNVSRQSVHFEDILDVNYQFLDGVAAQIGKDGVLLSQKNQDMLSAIKSTTSINHVALIEPDGTSHYENGDVKDVSHRDYFKEGITGQRILSDPVQSSVDHETRVILGVPVLHNDSVIGLLGASYNVTALNHLMFDDLFGSKGFCIIIDEDGNIITLDGNSDTQKISYTDNFFEFFDKWNFRSNNSLQEIRDAFQTQSDGVLKLIQPEDPDSSRYIAYTPLHLNNWMMCYIIPVSVANESYMFVHDYELALNGYFMVLVLLLIWRIAVIHTRDRKELVHSAQIDGLTAVYNKEHTQPVIDAFLRTCRPDTLHAFLILDIDKFKDVNDTWGHAVGDLILQRVGAFLKNQFRDDDIIGRIGGDEFVILMKNIGNKDIALNRVETMLNQIRSIKQPEMDNQSITFSVGVAFSPEQGIRFDNLYRNADKALYQTKRGGRNNYTVYEKA
ncbi:sensor domain-containing diguanylate cyclase [Clostridium sp. AF32-12BH]|nr:sensor domain-containing diguanylate cyclase [Clostridium sp. AF32-12BH]